MAQIGKRVAEYGVEKGVGILRLRTFFTREERAALRMTTRVMTTKVSHYLKIDRFDVEELSDETVDLAGVIRIVRVVLQGIDGVVVDI